METKILDEQKQVNSSHDLVQAREDSNKRMNLSSEKPFEWLNENSRKFLAAGYIGEGVCAEERIANIAKRAEEILQMPGYAEKFYYYMSEGFILWHHLFGQTLGKSVVYQSVALVHI